MKTSDFISVLIHNSKTAEPVENNSDYTRVKRWVNKATALYVVFTIFAIIITVVAIITGSFSGYIPFLIPFVSILASWGFATIIMNFKLLVKSMVSAGINGFQDGEQIQTNHVSVSHDYGNRYKVSTYTEHQGCAGAMIYGFINFFVWAFLCVYVCPFLTLKKIGNSKKNLKKFKVAKMLR